MRLRISLATVAMMGICSAKALAQAPAAAGNTPPSQPPKTGATSVALVDVGYIIKNHPNLNAEMERLNAEVKTAQEQIEQRRTSLLAESEKVAAAAGAFDTSHPDFKAKQEQLLNQESKLRVDFLGQEKEFAEKRATVMAKSYQDVSAAINTVAEAYKFDLVLRYSKEQNEMNPKNPQSVSFGVQRDVLFQAPGLDVTDYVLYVLKSRVPAVPTATANTAGNRMATPVTGNRK
ncbi:MAG: OmpH family outer membrane protein [Planctomycetota bacterium]|nr:OmpH family outer membrane protein [Planctomycetota bacterium]